MEKKCPNCNSLTKFSIEYPEGTIWICGSCNLEYGKIREEYKEENNFDENSIVHAYYMEPKSVDDPMKYLPYVQFFSFISEYWDKKRMRILDVGCGNGLFIELCLSKGLDPVGVEIDEKLANVMSCIVKDRVIFKSVEDIHDFGEPFDIVTFWDSFEHLEKAFSILNGLRRFLKRKSLVYLRVNNNRDVYNYFSKVFLRICPWFGGKIFKACFNFPMHRWNFSCKSMKGILEKNGWKIIHCSFNDTPASRFTSNIFFLTVLNTAYLINRIIKGGKIGNYYIVNNQSDPIK